MQGREPVTLTVAVSMRGKLHLVQFRICEKERGRLKIAPAVLDDNQFTNKLFGGFVSFRIWWFAAFFGLWNWGRRNRSFYISPSSKVFHQAVRRDSGTTL